MATIRDVAKKAGVAPMTVSRVLNNSGYVSPETRRRVEAAAAELNYVPNMLARQLSLQAHGHAGPDYHRYHESILDDSRPRRRR